MKTTLRDPTARLLNLLSRRPASRRLGHGSDVDLRGFTLRSDRGRGSFLRHRTAEDRSDLAD